MQLNEAIKNRRSIRKWQDKKVPKRVIEKLVEAAAWAPSSCNRQAVKILVVAESESKKFLGKSIAGAVGFAEKAPLVLVVMADVRVYSLPGERHTAFLDCAAAIQNILLKAHELRLGACWINWILSRKNEKIAFEKFNIPVYFLPTSIIALGFPAVKVEIPERKPLREFVKFEKF